MHSSSPVNHHPLRRALFEHVFTVPEHLVRSLAPPGLEGAESAIREQLRVREVLELGVGTGPNLKYYAAQPWVRQALPWTQAAGIGAH